MLDLLQNVVNFQSGQSHGGLSDETMQQLIWLAGKQRSKQQRGPISGAWGLGYLAQYFDVTTEEVLRRIIWSAVPIRKSGIDFEGMSESELTAPLTSDMGYETDGLDSSGFGDEKNSSRVLEHMSSKRKHYSYMERFIQNRPDLYGPFWVSTTLIFAVAIFSNIVAYSSHSSKLSESAGDSYVANNSLDSATLSKLDEWHYSMDELNMTASLVMFHVILLPIFLWFMFWFRGCTKYYTLTETICAYGYSLSIYVPLAALLMIQVTFIRCIVLMVASLLSGLVLVMSFMPSVSSDPRSGSSHFILVLIFAFQLGLAYILHRIMLK